MAGETSPVRGCWSQYRHGVLRGWYGENRKSGNLPGGQNGHGEETARGAASPAARNGQSDKTHRGEKLGAEKDGLALEHFDGDEEGESGVNAVGGKDQGDKIPVICARDEFFAQEACAENGNEGKLGSELDAGKHGGDGGNDDDKCHRGEIALGFFVSFGEESDGHEDRGKKDGNGKSHKKDGGHGFGSEMQEKARSGGPSAGGL